MRAIWKFPLEFVDDQRVEMPSGARLLSVQMQGDVPCLWADVDTLAAKVERAIQVAGTGHNRPSFGAFVATVQLPRLGLVFHFFDGGES
jgi:hypothetical protein